MNEKLEAFKEELQNLMANYDVSLEASKSTVMIVDDATGEEIAL